MRSRPSLKPRLQARFPRRFSTMPISAMDFQADASETRDAGMDAGSNAERDVDAQSIELGHLDRGPATSVARDGALASPLGPSGFDAMQLDALDESWSNSLASVSQLRRLSSFPHASVDQSMSGTVSDPAVAPVPVSLDQDGRLSAGTAGSALVTTGWAATTDSWGMSSALLGQLQHRLSRSSPAGTSWPLAEDVGAAQSASLAAPLPDVIDGAPPTLPAASASVAMPPVLAPDSELQQILSRRRQRTGSVSSEHAPSPNVGVPVVPLPATLAPHASVPAAVDLAVPAASDSSALSILQQARRGLRRVADRQ